MDTTDMGVTAADFDEALAGARVVDRNTARVESHEQLLAIRGEGHVVRQLQLSSGSTGAPSLRDEDGCMACARWANCRRAARRAAWQRSGTRRRATDANPPWPSLARAPVRIDHAQ